MISKKIKQREASKKKKKKKKKERKKRKKPRESYLTKKNKSLEKCIIKYKKIKLLH